MEVYMPEVIVQTVSYGGWEYCVRISNDLVELIITVDVGPRIIRYGFPGEENEMCEVKSTMGLKGGDEWRVYGGHRLWHSPEAKPRSYEPDNSPVSWEKIPDGIRTIQDVERMTGIQKEMEITLSPAGSSVNILHRLINKGPWSVEMSVWSISAMATGGKEIIPFAGRDTGLLPNRVLSLWPYTRLNDPRIRFGEKYIVLNQDPGVRHPFKLGIPNEHGWAAYFNHNHLFVKYYTHIDGAVYPDFGVSYESYMNDYMLEMETLSPLTKVGADAHIEHMEKWELFDNVPMPGDEEVKIEKALTGRVKNNSDRCRDMA